MSSKLEALGFRIAATARSIVYFATIPNLVIGARIIDLLIDEADRRNARICLHRDPSARQHDMIIIEHAGKTYPAHRHPSKSETVHVIRGMLRTHIYEDSLHHQQNFDLVSGSILRIEPMTWHKNEAISNFVVYHETKSGPFDSTVDNEMAPWEKTA